MSATKLVTENSVKEWAKDKDECYVVVYAVWCSHCQDLMQRLQNEVSVKRMHQAAGGAYPETDLAKFVEEKQNKLDVKGFPSIRHYVDGERQEDSNQESLIQFLKNRLLGSGSGRERSAGAANVPAPWLKDGFRGQRVQARGRSPSPARASRGCGRTVAMRARSPAAKPVVSWALSDGYRTQQRGCGRNARSRSPTSRR
jgi:hypothetical protein